MWQNFVNTNILAVLLFVHVVATLKENPYDLLTSCRDIVIDVIPNQSFYQMADYNLIIELGKRLQNSE
jgi:hypothetical protein